MSNNELRHFGVLGMKWGIRRYQNKDGSLTPAGMKRYGRKVQNMEREAKERYSKEKNLKWYQSHDSTGKNFDKAESDYQKMLENDAKRKELSKKAHEAERKRLLSEKPFWKDGDGVPKDQGKYEEFLRSEEYKKLSSDSFKATQELEAYISKKGEEYVDVIKEAKLKDLNITKNKEVAKRYLSETFDKWFFDFDDLTYNEDNSYSTLIDDRY